MHQSLQEGCSLIVFTSHSGTNTVTDLRQNAPPTNLLTNQYLANLS